MNRVSFCLFSASQLFHSHVKSSQFYLYSPISQITYSPQGALQSVQHTTPSVLTAHVSFDILTHGRDANAVFWTGRLSEQKLLLPLSNFTLSDDFLWGLHEGCLVLTLQMTPNQKPQHSFFWLMKYVLDSNHSPVDH